MLQRRRSSFYTGLLLWSVLFAPTLARAQDTSTLSKIKANGAITFGYREASFGFSYLDGASAKPVGYSIDICNRIVEAVKNELRLPAIEIKYQAVTSANRIPLVQNGTVDIECGSTTNLVERQKLVAFSPDIFRYNVRTLVKADSGIKTIADLQGKTVVTTAGTTSFRLLREADKGRSLEVTQLAGKDHTDSSSPGRERTGQRVRTRRHPARRPDRQRAQPKGFHHRWRKPAYRKSIADVSQG